MSYSDTSYFDLRHDDRDSPAGPAGRGLRAALNKAATKASTLASCILGRNP